MGHAEIAFGSGMFMVGPTRTGDPASAQTPNQLGGRTSGGMYVIVDDPDAHCERARAAGAEITREPADMEYGSREYSARDPEGHTWSFVPAGVGRQAAGCPVAGRTAAACVGSRFNRARPK